jgi:hypothetical protein
MQSEVLPMSLTIACSACRKQLALPEGLLGQLVSCPGCHHAFTVIDEAGRLSIHVQGSERAIPAIPVNYDDIPTVLPAPPRAPYVPGARAPRPFVFRVFVIEDPDNRVDGSMHARISASGLELRDKRDLVYRISPGCESRYLGRNVFEVTLDGKPIKIRVSSADSRKTSFSF